MDFLNHKEGVWFSLRFSSFLLYRNCKRLREFEEIGISSKAVEVTVNNKDENFYDFCLDFVQEFGLWSTAAAPPPPPRTHQIQYFRVVHIFGTEKGQHCSRIPLCSLAGTLRLTNFWLVFYILYCLFRCIKKAVSKVESAHFTSGEAADSDQESVVQTVNIQQTVTGSSYFKPLI
jgi:hypothetical protein